jgi:ribonuclease HII
MCFFPQGFDDSKQLKEGERDKFLQDILSHPSIGYVVKDITAREIAEVCALSLLKSHPHSNSMI